MKIKAYECEHCGNVRRHINMHDDKCCYECWDFDTDSPKHSITESQALPKSEGKE